MADQPQGLTISYSQEALDVLDEIWDWNAGTYGPDHATGYIAFLRAEIGTLALRPLRGTSIEQRPDFRYLTIRRRTGGHGHLAVYTFDDRSVTILRIFHTAQDWQKQL